MLFRQEVVCAGGLGRRENRQQSVGRKPAMAITTSGSINVKALRNSPSVKHGEAGDSEDKSSQTA